MSKTQNDKPWAIAITAIAAIIIVLLIIGATIVFVVRIRRGKAKKMKPSVTAESAAAPLANRETDADTREGAVILTLGEH